MSTHPRLVWPRSDGNTKYHPPVGKSGPTGRWYEPVERGDPRYIPFEEAAGSHLASILGLPPRPSTSDVCGADIDGYPHRIPMPDGYIIFVTKRAAHEASGSKEHLYCYGSSKSKRFRPNEWKDHAEWLFDTSKPLEYHDQDCACMLNRNSDTDSSSASIKSATPLKAKILVLPEAIPEVPSRAASAAPAPKPPAPKAPPVVKAPVSAPAPPSRPLRPPPSKSGSTSDQPARIPPPSRNPTLNLDAPRPNKRRRQSVETDDTPVIPPPDISGVAHERGVDLRSQRRFRRGELVWVRINTILASDPSLPEITHWPMLIGDIRLRVIIAPPDEEDEEIIPGDSASHCWAYHLRPLGMFSPKDDLIRDHKDLLPWALGDELLGGPAGWTALAKEGTRVMNEGIAREAEEGRSKEGAEERWMARWGQRILFVAMGKKWELAVFRLSVAMRTAAQIAQCWSQTDPIVILSETILSDADRQLANEDKKSFYQGLWLGGERIWVDDIVRLRKSRAELPFKVALEAETAAATKASFLKIRAIAFEKEEKQWHCHLYGDVAELVVIAESGETTWTEDGITIPLVVDYVAPHGLKFKRLNELGTEVKCDVSDIAGRLYPDLLDPNTQNWLHEAGRPLPGRRPPNKTAMALKGRFPGTVAHSGPAIWIDDLYAIVETACNNVEKSLKEYYVSELDRLYTPPTIPRPLPRKPDPPAPAAIAVLRPISTPNNALPPSQALARPVVYKPPPIVSAPLQIRKPVPVAPAAPALSPAPAVPAPPTGLSKLWTQDKGSEIVYTLVESSPEPMVE